MSLNTSNMLTIGSIVKLKNEEILMVVGYAQIKDDNNYYDYMGVIYPDGLNINNKEYKYFNNEEIDKVEHYGYSNDKDKEYKDGFIKLLDNMGFKNE